MQQFWDYFLVQCTKIKIYMRDISNVLCLQQVRDKSLEEYSLKVHQGKSLLSSFAIFETSLQSWEGSLSVKQCTAAKHAMRQSYQLRIQVVAK